MTNKVKQDGISTSLVLKFAQTLEHSVAEIIDAGLITEADFQQFIESIEPSYQLKSPSLLRSYCRACSLVLGTPEQLQNNQWEPRVSIEFATNFKKITASTYEVSLTIDLNTHVNTYSCYTVHHEQVGQFDLTGLEGPALAAALHMTCPAILYPYINQDITNKVRRVGFELTLPAIDFAAVYKKAQNQNVLSQSLASTRTEAVNGTKFIVINGQLQKVTLH